MIDRKGQTGGKFTRDDFTYLAEDDAYLCPEGRRLVHAGIERRSQAHVHRPKSGDCTGCPQKEACTRGTYRKLTVSWHEDARQTVHDLARTEEYQCSKRQRYKVERLFGELKSRFNLRRLRLRRLRGASEQFLMAATAQNIKRLVKHLDQMAAQPA